MGEDPRGEVLRRDEEVAPLGKAIDEVHITKPEGKAHTGGERTARRALSPDCLDDGEEAREERTACGAVGQRYVLHHKEGIEEAVNELVPIAHALRLLPAPFAGGHTSRAEAVLQPSECGDMLIELAELELCSGLECALRREGMRQADGRVGEYRPTVPRIGAAIREL